MKEKRVKFNLCNVSETNDADLNYFFICLRYSDAPTMRGFEQVSWPRGEGK